MNGLLTLAVIPPLYLMFYVYRLDSVEKEPKGLIMKLVFLGMLSCIPAGIIESVLSDILNRFLDPYSILSILVMNYLIVAAAEEGVKFWVTKRTWNNPAFNYRFDGVVYAVAASIGFALLENVMYVFMDEGGGLMTGLMRAVTSIPGHCTFGVFMGLYYGEAKYAEKHGDPELCRWLLRRAYRIPLLLHGTYDFILSTDWDFMIIVFFAYIFVLYTYAKKRIRAAAAADEPVDPPQVLDGYRGYPWGNPFV